MFKIYWKILKVCVFKETHFKKLKKVYTVEKKKPALIHLAEIVFNVNFIGFVL